MIKKILLTTLLLSPLITGCYDGDDEREMRSKTLMVKCLHVDGSVILDNSVDEFIISYENITGDFYKNHIKSISSNRDKFKNTHETVFLESMPEMNCSFRYELVDLTSIP